MSEEEGNTIVYTPSQVSERLGISQGMTRRYLLTYESVTGCQLPRDSVTSARLVSQEAMSLLEAARSMVREDASLPVAKALKSLLGLHTAPTPPKSVFQQEEALNKLIEVVTQQSQEIRGLREELAGVKRLMELPAPKRPWWKLWG